jgi:hypothetical protein
VCSSDLSIAVLEDQEERGDNKLGLKEFYKIIIHLLAPDAQDANCDRLINRLDFGGISLSSYHSKFGAYNEGVVPDSDLVRQFANEDDAQGLLQKFIDRAKENTSLLKSLHDALPKDRRTAKAQILYDHVFEDLFQHYKQIKMQDIAQHSSSKKRMPNRAEFEIDVGLVQGAGEVDQNVNQSEMDEDLSDEDYMNSIAM